MYEWKTQTNKMNRKNSHHEDTLVYVLYISGPSVTG
jgi:hypothetical protein